MTLFGDLPHKNNNNKNKNKNKNNIDEINNERRKQTANTKCKDIQNAVLSLFQ